MPLRKIRRQRRADLETLTATQRQQMLTGRGWFPDEKLPLEDMRAAWELHAESLRAEWAEVRAPGTRCFAEWLFVIGPKHGERPTTANWDARHEQHRKRWLTFGILHTSTWPAMQEAEHLFLHRVGYIDDQEYQAACAAMENEELPAARAVET